METRTPRAPMSTAKSRQSSAVRPLAMPPRSREGSAPAPDSSSEAARPPSSAQRPAPPADPSPSVQQSSALQPPPPAGASCPPSAQREGPTRRSKRASTARSADSMSAARGADGRESPARNASRIPFTSHSPTRGPINGLNAPPVASDSAKASRSNWSVAALTDTPGQCTAPEAPTPGSPTALGQPGASPPVPPAGSGTTRAAALRREISEAGRNTLHMASWRATRRTQASTTPMPSPPQPTISTRVPIAGKDERHRRAPGPGALSRSPRRGPCPGRRRPSWTRPGRGCPPRRRPRSRPRPAPARSRGSPPARTAGGRRWRRR